MLPYKSLLIIDKQVNVPLYQQIGTQLISLIHRGILPPGQKLPGTRQLSLLLNIHRKNITKVYDDLLLQGWLETKPASGTYVSKDLPVPKPQKLGVNLREPLHSAGFKFGRKQFLYRPIVKSSNLLHLDDGFPDARLAPLKEFSRAYRHNILHGHPYQKLGYTEPNGTGRLREQLAIYLNESRGLCITAENIMVTRGTIMAVFLTSLAFVQRNDTVVMGETGWQSAKVCFQQAGASLITIPIDEHGIVVDKLEAICRKKKVRLVYVTPHHHYPTTVTMKADRRIQLLELARKYQFIVFEDDYDYDTHYLNKPLLPLVSADEHGLVLYAGSFSKSISPAFRIGYFVAPVEVIEHLSYYRSIIDRQGDNMMENAFAQLLQEGVIQKYLRTALKEYRQRRDTFCNLLNEYIGPKINFTIPDGGMAVWGRFDDRIDMEQLAEKALKQGLYISNGKSYNLGSKTTNGTRLGFASSSVSELERSVAILKQVLKK